MNNKELEDEIRSKATKCSYCGKKPDYFCDECYFALCSECMETDEAASLGKCLGDCFKNSPDMIDIDMLVN